MTKKRLHELKNETKAELDKHKEISDVPEPPEESKPILGDDIVEIDYNKSLKEIFITNYNKARKETIENERIKEERKRADKLQSEEKKRADEESKPILSDDIVETDYNKSWKEIAKTNYNKARNETKENERIEEERKRADKLQDFEKQYQEKGYFQLKGNIKSLIVGTCLLCGLAVAAMIFFGGSAGGPAGVHFTGERLILTENLFDILSIIAIALAVGSWMVISSMKKIKVSKDTVQINKRTYDINDVSVGIEAHAGYTLLGMDKYERKPFSEKKATDPVYMYIDRTKKGKKEKRYSLMKYDDYEIEAMLTIMKSIRE